MGTLCSTEIPTVRFVPPERRVRRALPAQAADGAGGTRTAALPNSDPPPSVQPRVTAARPGAPSLSSPLRPQPQLPVIATTGIPTSPPRSARTFAANPLVATTPTTIAEDVGTTPGRHAGHHLSPQPSAANAGGGRRSQSFPPPSVSRGADPLLLPSEAEARGSSEADAAAGDRDSFQVSQALQWSFASVPIDGLRSGSGAAQATERSPAAGVHISNGTYLSRSAPDDPFALVSQRTSTSTVLWGSSFASGEANGALDVPPATAYATATERAA